MQKYKEIRIWDFPPARTTLYLKSSFRKKLFLKCISKAGSQYNLITYFNKASQLYGLRRKYRHGNIYCWIQGKKKYEGKVGISKIPLWVLIECSKLLTKNKRIPNACLLDIERNIDYYCSPCKSNVLRPHFPLLLTPELFSIIFHFMGDGHIALLPERTSSYRQMNREGLHNFLKKMQNIFGSFSYSKQEFEDGRLNIPRVISDFYVHYFKVRESDTFTAYIPSHLKSFPREFLIAAFTAFFVDEGNVADLLTIYSKNKRLIEDIREITLKCGYICYPVREKYAYGKFDCYRFTISVRSFQKIAEDIHELSLKFPTCTFVQKQNAFLKKIR